MSENLRLRSSEERLKEELKELRAEVRKLTAKVDSQQDEIEVLCIKVEELSASEKKKEKMRPRRGLSRRYFQLELPVRLEATLWLVATARHPELQESRVELAISLGLSERRLLVELELS